VTIAPAPSAGPRRRPPALAAILLVVLATVAVIAAAAAPGPAEAETVKVDLVAKHRKVTIAPGVKMKAWTFNGKVPGPVIRVEEGDTIEVALRNADRMMAHSVDFHAAQVSPQHGFADVPPGETRTFSFVARRPGVFLYHCGTSPVLQHIGMGMYGAILVDPAGGRAPAREKVLVQSEFYGPVEHATFEHTQTVDREALRSLVLSRSYCAVLAEEERAPILGRVDRLFDEHARDGLLTLPYVVECFRAERR